MGITVGSAFRAIAGFGLHANLHNEAFFELAGELPVQVEFMMTDELAKKLLAMLHKHELNLFYVRFPVETGIL